MKLKIRNANLNDGARLAEIYNHYVLHTHATFDLEPVEPGTRHEWVEQYNQKHSHRLIVAETNNQVIGYASSSQFRSKPAYDRSVETTIYLDHEVQSKGIGAILYGHLLDQLYKTDVNRCYSVIALPNDASVRLHKNLGFTEVGRMTEVGFKFDKYWDTLWLEKRL